MYYVQVHIYTLTLNWSSMLQSKADILDASFLLPRLTFVEINLIQTPTIELHNESSICKVECGHPSRST